MGDQAEEKTKEFSKEELNVWNVEKFRKYLKDRGIVITGDTRKRDLISNWGLFTTLPGYICNCVAPKSKNKLKLQREERKSS